MKRALIILSIVLCALTATFSVLFVFYDLGALLTLAITFGVCSYHFVMRLTVGTLVNLVLKDKVDYNKWWFRERKFEKKLFSVLKVKKWKKYMPTFSPNTFDPSKHSFEEICSATCQSEIIHEIIFLLSYLPILLYLPFGELAVFLSTSIVASLVDLVFVTMQRFNRPRLLKIIEKKKELKKADSL